MIKGDEDVNSITLECLMNPTLYRRYVETNTITEDEIFWGVEKYKSKILELTKNMMEKKINVPQISNSFNDYIKDVVDYFKFIEKLEIYKGEVVDISGVTVDCSNADTSLETTTNTYDDIIMNKPDKNVGLRKFVNIKHISNDSDISFNYPIIKNYSQI